ncbi:MAG: hypothetical protein CME36_19775 [unclassified Hahellaceae]|nr:hypothetical protein [Hahellaceae bacterium]|tara:strand:+ start:33101 stop:33547 length:447 start_codon:yes stop_codon:yes gene_type:complete
MLSERSAIAEPPVADIAALLTPLTRAAFESLSKDEVQRFNRAWTSQRKVLSLAYLTWLPGLLLIWSHYIYLGRVGSWFALTTVVFFCVLPLAIAFGLGPTVVATLILIWLFDGVRMRYLVRKSNRLVIERILKDVLGLDVAGLLQGSD